MGDSIGNCGEETLYVRSLFCFGALNWVHHSSDHLVVNLCKNIKKSLIITYLPSDLGRLFVLVNNHLEGILEMKRKLPTYAEVGTLRLKWGLSFWYVELSHCRCGGAVEQLLGKKGESGVWKWEVFSLPTCVWSGGTGINVFMRVGKVF
jgi:hypothetical protein